MSKSKVIALAEQARAATSELAELVADEAISVKQPKASTTATAKYQDKVGLVARTYKLKAADADAFKAACEDAGESQAAVLTRLMALYVSGEQPRACWFCRLWAKVKKKPPR